MGVTLRQIAARSGVAVSTVSAALSPVCKKRISQIKLKEIRNLASKMGYRPNLSARRLRTGKTYNIGVVMMSFLEHHPISVYFDLISRACAKRDYCTIPLAIGRDYSDSSKYLDLFEEHHVDGLLFFNYFQHQYDQYLRLWQNNNAMVFRVLDPSLLNTSFDSVLVDHHNAGKKLIDHILSQGWTEMFFVSEGDPADVPWGMASLRSWAEFQMQAGVTDINQNVIVYGERKAKNRYNAIKDFIASGRVKKGKTALVLDGGDGSSAVYASLAEEGLVVGKDVAVAAMNSLPENEFVSPRMTVLSESFEKVADDMVDQLITKIDGKKSSLRLGASYEPELVVGPSTRRC